MFHFNVEICMITESVAKRLAAALLFHLSRLKFDSSPRASELFNFLSKTLINVRYINYNFSGGINC